MYSCVHVCGFVHMYAEDLGVWKRVLGLQGWAIVSCLTWELGIVLRSAGRSVHALN